MDEEDIQLPTPQILDEPFLPRPPFLQLNSRKRSTRSDEDDAWASLHTSSDPALFSSDENPDAENYCGGKRRKKKTYAGTWWGDRFDKPRRSSRGTNSTASSSRIRPSRKNASKKEFSRNFDSGVFMNSDASTEPSSDSSFGDGLVQEQRERSEPMNVAGPRTPTRGISRARGSATASPQTPRTVRRIVPLQQTKEQSVVDIVRRCLDDSKEDVDLSALELEELPAEIRELSTMIRKDPLEETHFDSLVARPRLYLANNMLRQFPLPILDVSNVRLLSLRQNKLKTLPNGIRVLTKLETLNIAGNRLQSLPIEVLDLMINHRLRSILSDPNPWLVPSPEYQGSPEDLPRLPGQCSVYMPKVHVRQGLSNEELHLTMVATSKDREKVTIKSVPSLSELVLRQLSKLNVSKKDLSPLIADAPPNVANMLTDLHVAQNAGDRQCASCKRLYVQPAQSWIEWWNIDHLEVSNRVNSAGTWTSVHALPFELGICGSCV